MRLEERLPSSLHHGCIAFIEGDHLMVGMRSLLPFERRFLPVSNAREAAEAIRDMVTQGGGQLEVALWAMVLEARLHGKDLEALAEAKEALVSARRTNGAVAKALGLMWDIIPDLPQSTFASSLEDWVRSHLEEMDRTYLAMAEHGSRLVEDGKGVLTTCFPEHSFFLCLSLAREEGKRFTVYVPETRPYLQGAHLTAPGLCELGYDHSLVCDNMVASIVSLGRVGVYLTASDRATSSRWVVNKTGTLQNAIVCKAYGVPYYAFSIGVDEDRGSLEDYPVEWRDASEVRKCQGVGTTLDEVEALYPAFDIVPPDYVAGIITKGGVIR